MIKRLTLLFICIALFSYSTQSFARKRIITDSLDKAITDIEMTYGAVSDLTSSFTQKSYLAIMNKEIVNRGVMQWKKPGHFLIEYSGSQPKLYVSDNKKMWVYVPGDTQVEVYKVNDKSISKEALEFIRGFVNIKENYNITGWEKRGSQVELTLVPLFSGAPYSKLKCYFGADHLLSKVSIYNVSGNVSTYTFSNVRINNGLSSKIFKFKKPRGVKEVHIR